MARASCRTYMPDGSVLYLQCGGMLCYCQAPLHGSKPLETTIVPGSATSNTC